MKELAEKTESIRKHRRDRQTERRMNTKPEPHRTLTRQDVSRTQGKVDRHNRCFSELGAPGFSKTIKRVIVDNVASNY